MSAPVSKEGPFDPGATLCGHGDRSKRVHYLGGGLWICFECLVKALGKWKRS